MEKTPPFLFCRPAAAAASREVKLLSSWTVCRSELVSVYHLWLRERPGATNFLILLHARANFPPAEIRLEQRIW